MVFSGLTKFERLTVVLAILAILPPSLSYYSSIIDNFKRESSIRIDFTKANFAGMTACCYKFLFEYRVHNLGGNTETLDFIGAYAQDVEMAYAELIGPEKPVKIAGRSFVDIEFFGLVSVSKEFLPIFISEIQNAIGRNLNISEYTRESVIATREIAENIHARFIGIENTFNKKSNDRTTLEVHDGEGCVESWNFDPGFCVLLRLRTVNGEEIITPLRQINLYILRSVYVDDFFVNDRGWSPVMRKEMLQ